jgi:hypothetical protein
MELSECASKEQDPQKLSELVAEIDRMLQEKQDRLIRGIPASTTSLSASCPQRPDWKARPQSGSLSCDRRFGK